MGCQEKQQVVFLGRQIDPLSMDTNLPPGNIHGKPFKFQDIPVLLRLCFFRGFPPSDNDLHPGHQLF